MKSSSKWLVFLIILILLYLGWKYLWPGSGSASSDQAKAEDPALLLDRVWIDSKPDKYTDYVHAALFLDDIPMGLFQKASAYHAILELFEFKRDGNKVRIHFPQTETKKKFTYKVTRCDDMPPFDLCLTLSKHPWGGPKRYHGMRETENERRVLGDLRDRLELQFAQAGVR